MPEINEYDILSVIKDTTTDYVEQNFDKKVKPMVDEKVDNTIQLKWNKETRELFIYVAEDMLLPEE